jgi:hypothetical protein
VNREKGAKNPGFGGKKPSKPGKNPMTKFFAHITLIPLMLFRLSGTHKTKFVGGTLKPRVRSALARETHGGVFRCRKL